MSEKLPLKKDATEARQAFDEVFDSLSRGKKGEFIGNANIIYLFLEKLERTLPEK